MRSEIRYKGVTTVPSDYECEDGELAGALNVVGETEGLVAMSAGSAEFTLPLNREIWFVHKNVASGEGYTHYIVKDTANNKLRWITVDKSTTPITVTETVLPTSLTDGALSSGEVKVSITAVGNVLVLITSVQKYYWLWKGTNYNYLGSDLPEIDVHFTNLGWFQSIDQSVYSAADVTFVTPQDIIPDNIEKPGICTANGLDSVAVKIDDCIDSDDWPSATNAIGHVKDDSSETNGKNWPEIFTNRCMGLLNKLVAEAKKQGRFVMPHLVRAAWRLYDGSYAKMTTPVLMFNFGTHHQTVFTGSHDSQYKYGKDCISALIYPYTIDYYLKNLDDVKGSWGDIIKGITFFAGKEIYDYDQSGIIHEIERLYTTTTQREGWSGQTGTYHVTVDETTFTIRLPRPTMDKQVEQLRTGGPFYKIYDRSLEQVGSQYVMLYFSTKETINNKHYEIGTISVTIRFRYWNTNVELVIAAVAGDSMESLFNKIEEAVLATGLPLEVHKVGVGKRRYEKKVYDANMTVAIMSTDGKNVTFNLQATRAQAQPANIQYSTSGGEEALSVCGLTCYGSVLPSDRLPLSALEQQTAVNDDYMAHVEILPDTMAAYNNRLTMANLSVRYGAYKPSWNETGENSGNVPVGGYKIYGIWYYIKTDAGDIIVKGEGVGNSNAVNGLLHYLYYPDARCYKAIVKYTAGAGQSQITPYIYLQLPMKPSDTLNGAVFADRIPYHDIIMVKSQSGGTTTITQVIQRHYKGEVDSYKVSISEPTETADAIEKRPTTVLVSEVNNPFVWKASNVTSVGNSEVVMLAANTTALSQGQFGQHPMYAFTKEDGVWALSVGSNGEYRAVQPVTRDIVLGKGESITQTDDSVLFAAERGIMMLSGSRSVCISDDLNSEEAFKVVKALGTTPETYADADNIKGGTVLLTGIENGAAAADIVPFNEFLTNCRMVYDYRHQRVVVYNADKAYAYVWSIKGRKWTQMPSKIAYALNGYPEAIVVGNDSKVTDLSGDGDGTLSNIQGMVFTRPLKLGNGDVLKTITSVIQRGDFATADMDGTNGDHVKQVLYGSRDLERWFVVGSSSDRYLRNIHGTAYKYFRLGLKVNLTEAETLVGCTIDWTAKQTNQSR